MVVHGFIKGDLYMYKRVSVSKKRVGGKMVCVDLVIDETLTIRDIVISGDFFAYPSESIEELEGMLRGLSIEDAIKVIEREPIVLVGVSKEDLIELFKEAMHRVIA